MKLFRCDRCGTQAQSKLHDPDSLLLITARDPAGQESHFCTIHCALTWATTSGYHTPDHSVVDAEIYCGSDYYGRDCKFTDGHPGPHVAHTGETWDNPPPEPAPAPALDELLDQLHRAARCAHGNERNHATDSEWAHHYQGITHGLHQAIRITEKHQQSGRNG